jgi:hypothetical protein
MNTSNVFEPFKDQQKSHVAILGLNTRFGSFQIFDKRKRFSAFIIDETILQIGRQHFWLWTCIEPIHNSVLGLYISKEKYVCSRKFHRIFS